MATTIEQDIADLDRLLRDLKSRYDLFFAGDKRKSQDMRKLEETENQVLAIIRTQSGRSISNPSMRFRFNNVVARYNSLKPVWARKRRELEEGKVVIPFMTGRKMAPAADVAESPPARPVQRHAAEPRGRTSETPAAPRAVASAILSSGTSDGGSIRRLYDAYVGELGPEKGARIPFQAFESQIATQVSRHMAEGAAGIKFQVVTAEGKVRITSKPLRTGRSEG